MGDRSAGPRADQVARASAGDRLRLVLDTVLAETGDLLGWDPGDIDPGRPYLDYGYNSLAAVELTTRLSRIYGVELPLTLLFDQPTPDAVARDLLVRLGLAETADGAVSGAAPAPDPPGRADDDEAIAIVGMACRFPGGADSPDALWQVVAQERDAISAFPTDRGWDLDALYHPDPDHPGTATTGHGGFLATATEFDAEFFGIGPREARAMDPQQRLLLEGVWEALEDAGIDPRSLRGSDTGVFAGISGTDYAYRARAEQVQLQGYWGLGTLSAVASGRVAYSFGFGGPALTVDTACSSSLVALHLGVRSLRSGECSLAVAGGVTVMSTPSVFLEFSRQRALSPDGRCRSYAAGAQGTGFSDGLGVLVLERLGDARRLGHRVWALIRGTAINQDGASNGLTAPHGPAQERVIRAALADAGVEAADVDAVEGHGTATVLGDPVEINALAAVYGRDRDPDRPLRLGSLKSNVGHAQAAAGAGGVIKAVLALREGMLPATLHAEEPTPKADWADGGIELLRRAQPWPRSERVRRIGVSAFGASGTNAHVIVEEAPAPAAEATPAGPAGPAGPVVWVVSAKTPSGLSAQARRLREWAGPQPEPDLGDVGLSLATTRAHLPYRAALIGTGRDDMMAALDRLAFPEPGSPPPRAANPRPGRVAFVFPGQGSQWPGMATALLGHAPVFDEQIRLCAEALKPHVEWDLLEVLRGAPDAPGLDRVDVVQPALFAVMVSLAALWRSYGIHPEAVVGHSQGEIAAACVAGALSLDDAARIVALRSGQIARLGGGGGMLSIARPVADVRARLRGCVGELSIAAVNGPSSVVVCGDSAALDEFYEDCVAEGVWARRIAVDYASHSSQVEPLRQPLLDALAGISPRAASVAFHSTVTGGPADTATLDAEYWYTNLRNPVLFEQAVRDLIERGFGTFLEISPHPVLTTAVTQTAESAAGAAATTVVTGSLTREQGDLADFLRHVGEAYAAGLPVQWAAAFAERGARRISLPGYAFSRQRFWADGGEGGGDSRAAGLDPARHPVLAGRLKLAEGLGTLFTGRLGAREHPWLADHTVHGDVIVPGTVFVEAAASAGARVGSPVVEELIVEAPLLVRDEAVGLQVLVGEADAAGRRAFTVHAEDGAGGWVRQASGTVARAGGPAAETVDPAAAWPPADAAAIPVDDLYDRLAERGMRYGPAFRGLRAAWRQGTEIMAELRPDEVDGELDPRHLLHPALLDAALHAAFADRAPDSEPGTAWLPFAWSGVRLAGGDRLPPVLRVRITPTGPDAVRMAAWDADGRGIATVDSVLARPVSQARLATARPAAADCLFAVEWTPHTAPASPAPDTAWEIAPMSASGDGSAAAARDATLRTLTLVRQWLAADHQPGSRLAVVTQGAVAARPGEAPAPESAALWGLVRSAQAEHPGRIALLDIGSGTGTALATGPDTDANALATGLDAGTGTRPATRPSTGLDAGTVGRDVALPETLRRALAVAAADEPQVAVRDGVVLVPRVRRCRPAGAEQEPSFDPERTVLITGGTGGLGALVARHLVREHGVRHLLLASRRGAAAPEAAGLAEELRGLGATAVIEACDVSDRAAVAGLLASVPAEHPLGAVVHSAGVLEDSLIAGLTADRLDRVMRAKVDSAWHLHELTADQDLSAFVLFSSLAGVLGGPGQGNYAAANSFLDALAQARRAEGRPALSIAWGLWEQPGDMTRHLDAGDTARLAGAGVLALTADEGLRLLDAALRISDPLVLAARLDLSALRAQAADGLAPAPLRDLVPVPAASQSSGSATVLAALAGLTAAEQEHEVLRLVCAELGALLRYPDGDTVPADMAFKDLGLDSLGAVQLRNRIGRATGITLPVTAMFDHPTPRDLARLLLPGLVPDDARNDAPADTRAPAAAGGSPDLEDLDSMDAEDLVRLALRDDL